MKFSASNPAAIHKTPLYFRQLREGETLDKVAAQYSVDVGKLMSNNPGMERPGDIVVINLKDSALS
jgi:hypothetical protein